MIEADKLQKDAVNLAEIVVRIISLQYEGVKVFMTIFGYMVLNIVKAVASMQKHDPDMEMAKFINYLTDIYAKDDEYKRKMNESKEGSNIIKLN